MLLEKEKAVENVANIFQSLKPSGPAPKAKATPAPNDPKKSKPKPSAAMGEIEEVTPVKPSPNAERHLENKKGKGKGDGKDRGRNPNVNKKKITCKFFAKGKCNLGKGCPYSHKKLRIPSRSISPKGEGEVPFWNWIRGNCPKGKEYKFYYDPKATPKKGHICSRRP